VLTRPWKSKTLGTAGERKRKLLEDCRLQNMRLGHWSDSCKLELVHRQLPARVWCLPSISPTMEVYTISTSALISLTGWEWNREWMGCGSQIRMWNDVDIHIDDKGNVDCQRLS